MKVPQKILEFSIISYSTQSKKVFFLKKPIIDKFGVVSKEVAIKMSTKLSNILNLQILSEFHVLV